MGAPRLGAAHRPLSEINVTPFVDVMLVLLVIFMVTAPMMLRGLDVDLPETTTQPLRVRDEPLVLTVKKDGKYYIGRREIPEAALTEKLVPVSLCRIEMRFAGRLNMPRTTVVGRSFLHPPSK